jgi:hypothetical protein
MPTTVTDRMPHPTSTRGCTCAECGGLECLCRPRFFAGQLLTEEELNRLDHYIVAKNRLQNRYLHGWGVVCGLDVVCDDCSSGVVVKPGYALSPCGDDVIVCADTAVDVCALVQRCTKKTRQRCEELTDADRRTAEGCDEAGDWVLAIRYAERSSRGVTPLRGGGCACGGAAGGCGCGGKATPGKGNGHAHGNGGCGCGEGGGGGVAAATRTSRFSSAARCTPALECEPTVICEGYCFEVYRLPPRPRVPPKGAMPARFAECVADLTAAIPPFPGAGSTPQQYHDWCCRVRDGLLDYLSAHPAYDCSLTRRVRAIVCPDSQLSAGAFGQALLAATSEIGKILIALLVACLCTALMPPCPEPVDDALVPLAVVTMSSTGAACRVTSICNWTTERKFATTVPSLQYWLSILPFGRMLRESIERLCCRILPPSAKRRSERAARDVDTGAPAETERTAGTAGAGETHSTASAATAEAASSGDEGATDEGVPTPADYFHASEPVIANSQRFARMALAALAEPDRSLDGETLLRGVFGGATRDGERAMPAEADDDLLAFIAIDQMVKPTLRATLPREAGIGSAIRMMAAFAGAATPESEESGRLASEVASLRETADRQNRAIEELRARMDNR